MLSYCTYFHSFMLSLIVAKTIPLCSTLVLSPHTIVRATEETQRLNSSIS